MPLRDRVATGSRPSRAERERPRSWRTTSDDRRVRCPRAATSRRPRPRRLYGAGVPARSDASTSGSASGPRSVISSSTVPPGDVDERLAASSGYANVRCAVGVDRHDTVAERRSRRGHRQRPGASREGDRIAAFRRTRTAAAALTARARGLLEWSARVAGERVQAPPLRWRVDLSPLSYPRDSRLVLLVVRVPDAVAPASVRAARAAPASRYRPARCPAAARVPPRSVRSRWVLPARSRRSSARSSRRSPRSSSMSSRRSCQSSRASSRAS